MSNVVDVEDDLLHKKLDTTTHAIGVVLFVLMTLGVFVLIYKGIINRNVINSSLKHNKFNIDNRCTTYMSIFCVFVYYFGMLSYLIVSIQIYNNDSRTNVPLNQSRVAALFLWAFGYLMRYIIFVYRLYIIFRNTVYEYSKWVFVYLFALIVFIVVDFILFLIEFQNIGDWNNHLIISYIITGFCADILVSLSILYLFHQRLFQITLNKKDTLIEYNKNTDNEINSYANSGNNNSNNDNNKSSKIILINFMTKISYLITITILLSIILVTLFVIYFAEEQHINRIDNISPFIRFEYFIWWVIGFDMFISSIIIALNISFMNELYTKTCCLCHKICLKICIYSIKNNDLLISCCKTSGIGYINENITDDINLDNMSSTQNKSSNNTINNNDNDLSKQERNDDTNDQSFKGPNEMSFTQE